MRHRVCRALAFCLLLAAAVITPAVEELTLRIDRIEAGAGRYAVGVNLTARPGGAGILTIDKLILGPPLGELESVRLTCPRLRLSNQLLACRDGRLRVQADFLAGQSLPVSFEYRFDRQSLALEMSRLALSFSAPAGSPAAQDLTLTVDLQAWADKQDWRFDLQLHAVGGQAYVEPVFVDFGTQPAHLSAQGRIQASGVAGRLTGFEFSQPGVAELAGDLAWRNGTLASLQAKLISARLPAAYATYLQPFVIGTPLDSLDTSGHISGRVDYDGAGLRGLEIDGRNLALTDRKDRFRLEGGGLHMDWRRQGVLADAPMSRLSWDKAAVYRIQVGTAGIEWRMAGGDLRLAGPLSLPLLDGSLRIDRAAASNVLGDSPNITLDAQLIDAQLAPLSRALGWPVFSGSLSGQLPRMHYRDDELMLEGGLQARVFDGEVSVANLRLANPLGTRPRLRADLVARDLALEAVTGVFSFGRISGRMDADILDLRMLGWRPVAFDAWIRTPEDYDGRRSISRDAIQDLTSLGGEGSNLATRGLIGLFDSFAYERIGLGCLLTQGVCHMRGLGAAPEGGYYIMRGAWLPRVDIIGHNRRVSWPVLLAQLESVTEGGEVTVK